MSKKPDSLLQESREINLAAELIVLGARLQLLESEISLSRDRLIKLYKELRGESPPKGMLPFSYEWFLTWQPNIHASLFLALYRRILRDTKLEGIEAILKSYKLYLEHLPYQGSDEEPVLSLTRAWTLIRFLNSALLTTISCECCSGVFVTQPYQQFRFVCGLCHVPNRAGKSRKNHEPEVLVAKKLA